MRDYLILVGVQLKGLFGINRFFRQKGSGAGKAARAVGNANNKNPILIFIPCHRVVGADGALVGFAAGLPVKEALLALERKYK